MSLVQQDLVIMKEEWLYDFNSFIGEVGGSLGLFMGLSFFSMFEYTGSIMQKAMRVTSM